jgi:hypothetical protein
MVLDYDARTGHEMSTPAKRSAVIDPQPGDVLRHGTYSITVTGREGNSVLYSVAKPGAAARKNHQTIEEWAGWAGGAKATLAGAECTVIDGFVAGPCASCGIYLAGNVHVCELLYCEEHCPAKKHVGRPKPRLLREALLARKNGHGK